MKKNANINGVSLILEPNFSMVLNGIGRIGQFPALVFFFFPALVFGQMELLFGEEGFL